MARLLYKSDFKPKKAIQIHLLCWAIFIFYEVYLSGILYGYFPFAHYFLFYLINVGIFYFHAYFLINHLSSNPIVNLWRIPLFLILELIIYAILSLTCSSILDNYLYHKPSSPIFFNLKYFTPILYRGIYFMLYATGYYFLINYIRKKEKTLTQAIENEQLKNEVLRAEQDFLRAQINPHLLFNTLSFIKYAARKRPDEADEAVIRLSGIMGFALDNNSPTILLTTEMEQVENIIGLNQLRYNHTLKVNYIKEVGNPQATIIPIILLTLVENVFKHGNLLDKEYPAIIRVVSTNEYILLQTSNLPSHNSHTRSTYTGLTNIRSRLKQFYKDSHDFNYGMDDTLFKVEIKINKPII